MEEKDILFRNTFAPTDRHYQLAFRNRIFGSTNLQAILLFAACGLLLLLVLVPRIIYGEPLIDKGNLAMFIVVLLLFGMTLLLYYGFPVFSSNAIKKNRKKSGLGPMTFDTCFLEDKLVINVLPDERQNEAPYTEFTRLTQMEDMLILTTRGGQIVMLSTGSFTKGTEAELKAFLEAKCPNAKAKWPAAGK